MKNLPRPRIEETLDRENPSRVMSRRTYIFCYFTIVPVKSYLFASHATNARILKYSHSWTKIYDFFFVEPINKIYFKMPPSRNKDLCERICERCCLMDPFLCFIPRIGSFKIYIMTFFMVHMRRDVLNTHQG